MAKIQSGLIDMWITLRYAPSNHIPTALKRKISSYRKSNIVVGYPQAAAAGFMLRNPPASACGYLFDRTSENKEELTNEL